MTTVARTLRRSLVRSSPRQASAIPDWRKPIVAVPLSQAFPEFGEVKEFRSKKCLFNADRTKLFDVVSSKYQVVDHGAAVDEISGALAKYFGKEVQSHIRSLDGGARLMGEFKLPIAPVKIGRQDVNEITLTLRNSYDRSWAFQATLGAFRLVCSNGMMIGEEFGNLSMKHVGGDTKDSQILEHLDVIIQRAPKLQQIWTEWADTPMEYEDAVNLIVGHFPSKYSEPVLDESHFPQTKWAFYNALTRFATHDTKSVRRRVEFDEKISRLFYQDQAV